MDLAGRQISFYFIKVYIVEMFYKELVLFLQLKVKRTQSKLYAGVTNSQYGSIRSSADLLPVEPVKIILKKEEEEDHLKPLEMVLRAYRRWRNT